MRDMDVYTLMDYGCSHLVYEPEEELGFDTFTGALYLIELGAQL